MNGRWQLLKKTCPAKAGRDKERRRIVQPPAGDRGFALVFTLLLLGMMSLIALAMVLSSSSDMLINGYYRNARGSFYAADSGLNVARQQLLDQIIAQVPSAFQLMPTNAAATACTNVLNMYASPTSLNAGQAGNSWVESFVIPNTACCVTPCVAPMLSIAPNSPTITATSTSTGLPTGYQYIYNYNISVMGTAQGSEQTTVSENGSFILSISGQASSTTINFAIYGAWVGVYPPCFGALIPGTMTGPMFTNGAWEFMTGTYIFTDPVGQANSNADYWFGGNCVQSPTSAYTYQYPDGSTQTIKPTFEGNPPFSLGQPAQQSPGDSFSQLWAAVDGKGFGETNSAGQVNNPQGTPPSTAQPTPTNMSAVLKDISGNPYPPGATTGVYVPYSCSGSPCTNTVTGGGIYVEGNAAVLMSIGNDTSASQNPTQSYTITQGSTTTTITTDVGANTTTVQSGSTTLTLAGVPTNCSTMYPLPPTCTSGLAGSAPGTMLYVNGTITSLSGPGQGIPAVQDGSQITITAKGNIDITGDVIYKTEPVTTTDNQIVSPTCCNGDPVSTLIPGNDKNQVLGMFTANGNINLMSPYSNNNLQVDGSLAPLQQGSQYCFTCSGYINTFNNVGGQIQSGICGCNMSTQNTYFDRRFTARAGFVPPWFPSTTITTTASTPAVTKPTVQHVQWLLKNM
jgi:Tfp pilus assembly protein PilX